jgi:hypothetical protein
MDREADLIVLEPKYCELCGGLWLRLVGSPAIYCVHCAPEVAALAPVRLRRDQSPIVLRRQP